MTILILIFLVLSFFMVVVFEPYIDVYKVNKKYHVVLWYTNLDGERNFFNILGGN